MRVKEYEVSYKDDCGSSYTYLVEAPSKRIAKWCVAAIFNHEYFASLTAKDMKAKRVRAKGE